MLDPECWYVKCSGCGQKIHCTNLSADGFCGNCENNIMYAEGKFVDESLEIADIVTDLLCEMGIKF